MELGQPWLPFFKNHPLFLKPFCHQPRTCLVGELASKPRTYPVLSACAPTPAPSLELQVPNITFVCSFVLLVCVEDQTQILLLEQQTSLIAIFSAHIWTNLSVFYVWECFACIYVCVYMSVPHIWLCPRHLNSLRLKLQAVVSC